MVPIARLLEISAEKFLRLPTLISGSHVDVVHASLKSRGERIQFTLPLPQGRALHDLRNHHARATETPVGHVALAIAPLRRTGRCRNLWGSHLRRIRSNRRSQRSSHRSGQSAFNKCAPIQMILFFRGRHAAETI